MVSGTVNREYNFLLEFFVHSRVPKRVYSLMLTQEHIYTIEFHSLATTKRRKIIRVQTVLVSINIPQ